MVMERLIDTSVETAALLARRVEEEIERNTFPRLAGAWGEFKGFLGSATPVESLYLLKKERLDLAVGTEDLLVTLLVDPKHFLVTVVELAHVKGVDFASHEGSARKGSEVQLSVWFLDNTRFYWESGVEELEQMRRFARFVRGLLGQAPKLPE